MTIQGDGAGPDRSTIVEMVISSLEEILVMGNGGSPDASDIREDTRLFGREAVLDSMGLVSLIVEVEQRLEDEYDVALVLADDRAMSMKRSPFRSVGALADYICQLIDVGESPLA